MPAAKIESVEALRHFRASLIKFATEARAALDIGDSDVQRTVSWVQDEARAFWSRQVHKCSDEVAQAAAALRHKKMIPTASGNKRDTADEEKALRTAKRRLELAEQKVTAVKKWGVQLPREAVLYTGQTRPLGRAVEMDVPRAVATLDRMAAALEDYLAVHGAQRPPSDETFASVARAALDAEPKDQPTKHEDTEPADESARQPGESE